ncbi:terpenoid cyclases/protein prenyltransferase alpha-alpha toroid [Morchella snyderi]|nr:terpenoid cyclases/protein prenyltransferase alpha-alpha toroid [Morchella snyderi]
MSMPTPPSLNKPKHVSYWLRCLKTCLPTDYTSTDLNRLTLGFFTIAALDLLGALSTSTSLEERAGWIDWIYHNQLPSGGFRGSPATFLYGAAPHWDPPNLPASFFALVTLISLGDNLERVEKKGLLALLPKMQRSDGSFGEWLGPDDEVVGSSDMRFIYCACAIRWILKGRNGDGIVEGVKDIDVDRCVSYIASAETYDHGISEKPFGEAHAGHTYCAISALSLLNRLKPTDTGISSSDNIVRWLVSRQIPFEARDGYDEEEIEELITEGTEETRLQATHVEAGADNHPLWAGFNGRCGKRGDTCYSFWVGGSLDVLKKLHLIDVKANRRFLLEKTQHFIGGFAKLPGPGVPPDIMHSFLGLAALALVREDGLNRLDAMLCISMQAKERLMEMDWWKDAPVS